MNKAIDQKKVGLGELDQEAVTEGASQAGLGVIIVLAALIGVWGIACLIGGLGKSAGFLEAAQGWLTAITGV
jgi:hypothetical protein